MLHSQSILRGYHFHFENVDVSLTRWSRYVQPRSIPPAGRHLQPTRAVSTPQSAPQCNLGLRILRKYTLYVTVRQENTTVYSNSKVQPPQYLSSLHLAPPGLTNKLLLNSVIQVAPQSSHGTFRIFQDDSFPPLLSLSLTDEEPVEHDPAPTECWPQLPPPGNIPGWESTARLSTNKHLLFSLVKHATSYTNPLVSCKG